MRATTSAEEDAARRMDGWKDMQGELHREANRAPTCGRAWADGFSQPSFYAVGKGGFEPPASTSRTWRANQAALLPVKATS